MSSLVDMMKSNKKKLMTKKKLRLFDFYYLFLYKLLNVKNLGGFEKDKSLARTLKILRIIPIVLRLMDSESIFYTSGIFFNIKLLISHNSTLIFLVFRPKNTCKILKNFVSSAPKNN